MDYNELAETRIEIEEFKNSENPILTYLAELYEKADQGASKYYQHANIYVNISKYLGIASITLSIAICMFAFVHKSWEDYVLVPITFLITSVTAVLAFLSPDEKRNKYQLKAQKFFRIRSDVERTMKLELNAVGNSALTESARELCNAISFVHEQEPHIYKWRIRRKCNERPKS